MMRRLFRFKRGTDGTWVEFHIRCLQSGQEDLDTVGLTFSE